MLLIAIAIAIVLILMPTYASSDWYFLLVNCLELFDDEENPPSLQDSFNFCTSSCLSAVVVVVVVVLRL